MIITPICVEEQVIHIIRTKDGSESRWRCTDQHIKSWSKFKCQPFYNRTSGRIKSTQQDVVWACVFSSLTNSRTHPNTLWLLGWQGPPRSLCLPAAALAWTEQGCTVEGRKITTQCPPRLLFVSLPISSPASHICKTQFPTATVHIPEHHVAAALTHTLRGQQIHL